MTTISPKLLEFLTTGLSHEKGSSRRHETDQGSHLDSTNASGHQFQNPIFQIVLAVCLAVVLSLIIIACAICFRNQRKEKRRKSVMKNILIGVDTPSPFAFTLNSQLMRDSSTSDSYNALDLITERPQEVLERDDQDGARSFISSHSSDTGNEHLDSPTTEPPGRYSPQFVHSGSVDTFDKISPRKRLKLMRRCRSVGNALSAVHTLEKGWDTTISVSIDYQEKDEELNVTAHKISDLPPKAQVSHIYIMAYLFPVQNDGIPGSVVPGDDEVLYDEIFRFKGVNLKDLEKCTLRLSIFIKKRYKSSKDAFVGEAFLLCSDVNWKVKMPQTFHLMTQRKKLKKESTPDKMLLDHLGELFVLLQYQQSANRMKVFLRRAERLPKSDKLIGSPVHYVIINLKKDEKIVDFRETTAQSGYNPVWNQPFLFDIKSDQIDQYSLEFLIMRGKRHTKDCVIGQVIIGPNGPKMGVTHWQEMLRPFSLETAKWHSVLPVFKY